MSSEYDIGGRRYDVHMFLDHDGCYERSVRRDPDYELLDSGRWKFQEADTVLLLMSDDSSRKPSRWSVLSVATCETSNILLVLRPVILGSRILPVLLYRVHLNGRGYGTDWEKRLAAHQAPPENPGD